jgi:acyl carrier protein
VRGFRIELGEIEAVLTQHPGVREVVVLAVGDAPADRRLLAYVVPGGEARPTVAELRDYLSDKLPDYMVPASFVLLAELPLTANGKIDRRALLQMRARTSESDAKYVAPRNETERVIAGIWQEALQTEKISVDDNFFDLGGHSLLMVSVHTKLREHFKLDMPIADLFKYPTIRLLTAHFTEETQQTSTQSMRDRARKQKEAATRKRLMRKPNGNGKNGSA